MSNGDGFSRYRHANLSLVLTVEMDEIVINDNVSSLDETSARRQLLRREDPSSTDFAAMSLIFLVLFIGERTEGFVNALDRAKVDDDIDDVDDNGFRLNERILETVVVDTDRAKKSLILLGSD